MRPLFCIGCQLRVPKPLAFRGLIYSILPGYCELYDVDKVRPEVGRGDLGWEAESFCSRSASSFQSDAATSCPASDFNVEALGCFPTSWTNSLATAGWDDREAGR